MMLNYLGLDSHVIRYAVDRNPHKHGKTMPGVHVPIVPPSRLSDDPTDDCLMIAWNYRDEILRKERGYLDRGGCFIVPLPRLEVIP